MSRRSSFLDSRTARLVALLVVAGCAMAIYELNRRHAARQSAPMPQGAAVTEDSDAGLNPDFIKCRDERVGQVEKMRSEGVVGDDKFAEFKDRAIATCAGQFPPGG